MSPGRKVSTLLRATDTVTYDTGALLAAAGGDRSMWRIHDDGLEEAVTPVVPAVVLAQAWRGGQQRRLSRLLASCVVESLGETAARQIGRLLGRTGTSDVVDAAVVLSAVARDDEVVTTDPEDLSVLAETLGVELAIRRV